MKQMYKVFLNDRAILIGSSDNITNMQQVVTFYDDCSKKDIQNWFRGFSADSHGDVYIARDNPEDFFRLFQSAFTCLKAAGGVVVSDNRLLFIFRHGKWDLPKGKMEKNETPEEAALREVVEETGILPGGIDFRLPSTYHIYESPCTETRRKWIFKETTWFQMNCTGNPEGIPQQDEGISLIKWVAKTGLQEVLANTYENLKVVINQYTV